MGVQSRGYMHAPRPEPRFWDGRSLTSWLILANVAVFVLWQIGMQSPGLGGFLARHFLVSPLGVLEDLRLHTLVTYAFSHKDLWHAFFNLLFVWWFGRELEEIYGARDYAVLYFVSAIVAGLAHVLMHAFWLGRDTPALGASGAVMGIVVVYAFFFPDRQVYLFFAIPIAIKWLAVLYVGLDLFGVMGGSQGRVAHAAHLGGALVGLLYYRFDLRIFSEGARFRWNWLRRWLAPRPPGPRPVHPETIDPPPPAERDPGVSARVDELLDKIAREGIGSLTAEEREFLDSASRHYKR